MPPIAKLLRPHHWLKNLFVFAAPFFAGALLRPDVDLKLGLVFAAFCCCASFVYILNDILDVDADRAHPKKRLRPIASGKVPLPLAWALAAALLAGSLALSAAVSLGALACVGVYVALNILYSWRLKQIPIVDAFCIGSGFALRMLAGGPALGLPLPPELLACGFFFTVMLAFGKRRVEIVLVGPDPKSRPSLEGFTLALADTLCAVFGGLALATYCLWAFAGHGQGLNPLLPASLLPVSLGFARHLWLMHSKGHGEDLAKEVFFDTPLLASFAAFVFLVGFITHFASFAPTFP